MHRQVAKLKVHPPLASRGEPHWQLRDDGRLLLGIQTPNGQIDEFTLFSKALTAKEIQSLYTTGRR